MTIEGKSYIQLHRNRNSVKNGEEHEPRPSFTGPPRAKSLGLRTLTLYDYLLLTEILKIQNSFPSAWFVNIDRKGGRCNGLWRRKLLVRTCCLPATTEGPLLITPESKWRYGYRLSSEGQRLLDEYTGPKHGDALGEAWVEAQQ